MKYFVLREPRHRQALNDFLDQAWEEQAQLGKPLAVHVAPEEVVRTTKQNCYYWAILHELAENGWVEGRKFSAEVWHDYFKRRFIGVEDLPNGGTMAKESKRLSTKAFNDYVTKVEVCAAEELGISIGHIDTTTEAR